jgi:hypothetical protein
MSDPQFPAGPEGGNQLNIELSADIAEGTYANLVMIAHSAEEFILDFIRVMPGVPQARVKSRIIVTPAHAKRLLGALAENLARYENTYGEINEVQYAGPDSFRFDGPGGEA